ncbi:MAG TPA: hypothetical protein VFV18_03175 [Porticoccaceae bacterium]|nr:hypothetical protein [Porticoccaceae bacterium]
MSLEDIYFVSQIVSALALIVSLLFVGIQIRQNTLSTQTARHQSIVQAISDWSREVALNNDIANLMVRGSANFEQLDPVQRLQFALLHVALFRNYENIFYQHAQGAIDDHVWEGWAYRMRATFVLPGVRAWWTPQRDSYSDAFRDFLEANPLATTNAPSHLAMQAHASKEKPADSSAPEA